MQTAGDLNAESAEALRKDWRKKGERTQVFPVRITGTQTARKT
jgi:hypothetical protein